MSTLNNKLYLFAQAQADLYNYLGISRRLTNGEMSEVENLHANHGSGNIDIPTAYPQVLDYRKQQWATATDEVNSDDEIHIKLENEEGFDKRNIIRFNILTIWRKHEGGEPTVFVHATHLPRPEELAYSSPDSVESCEQGINFYGDEVLIVLNDDLCTTTRNNY